MKRRKVEVKPDSPDSGVTASFPTSMAAFLPSQVQLQQDLDDANARHLGANYALEAERKIRAELERRCEMLQKKLDMIELLVSKIVKL